MGDRMIDIKEIAAKYDCRKEVESVLGSPHLRTAKSWAWRCPFHDDKTPSFHVYQTHYYCFGCEAHGDVLDWWAWSRDVPLSEIIKSNTVQPISPEEKQRIATKQAECVARELEEKIKEAQRALEELKKAQSWIRYHDNLTRETRALWRARGIPDEWQNYWKLGYSPACPTYRQSPSLTIPIFTPAEKEPVNIRHRLLCPETPGDKYRPEQSGLPTVPFYGDPELPVERAEQIIVIEGEIKAAVTFLTLDTPLIQVIGLPGKKGWRSVSESLKEQKNVFIMLDPDAEEESLLMAHEIGGARVVRFGKKIDDAIIEHKLDKNWINGLLQTGRRYA